MTDLLKSCVAHFKVARTSLFEGAALLYEIKVNNAWEGHFESYTAFVEEGCQMNKGYASKLLTAYEHYVLRGGVSQEKLIGVDHEKLYMAASLPGNVTKQLTMAKTLTRGELRAEQRDEEPCDEHSWIEICAKCHVKKI